MTHTTIPWGRAIRPTLAGGLAFWVANLAISLTPVAAAYRVALSIPYWPMTVAALAGGLLIAGCVSGLLLAVHHRLPGGNSIVRGMLLSLMAMGVIEAFSIMVDMDHLSIFHVIGVAMNVPRFVALGVAIGWLFDRSAPITRIQRESADRIAGFVE
jgi:hypothetical protein